MPSDSPEIEGIAGVELRFRALVFIEAGFEPGEYAVGKNRLRILQVGEASIALVEVALPSLGGSLEAVYVVALDVLDRFLDLASVATYCATRVLQIVSLAPSMVRIGERFRLITPGPSPGRRVVPLKPGDLPTTTASPGTLRAAALVRSALASPSIEERTLHLHSAMERLASEGATAKREHTCTKCGFKSDAGPDRARFIREDLLRHGATEDDAKNFARIRARVAHGDGPRDATYFHDLEVKLSGLEGPCVSAVADRLGVVVQNPINMVAANPLIMWDFKAGPFDFCLEGAEVSSTARATKVQQSGMPRGDGSVFWGIPLGHGMKSSLHPLAWPDLIESPPSDSPRDAG